MTECKQIMKTHTNGSKCWHNAEGWLHRDDGPAIIWPNGIQLWYQNGKVHRLTGPAVITEDGSKMWFINGVDVTVEVNRWQQETGVTYPWDAYTQALFVLRWG
jgi:hypothetical protein